MEPPADDQKADLEARLDALMRRQLLITSKETLKQIQYEVAEIRWHLGEITDEEFAEAEEFHDGFLFDF